MNERISASKEMTKALSTAASLIAEKITTLCSSYLKPISDSIEIENSTLIQSFVNFFKKTNEVLYEEMIISASYGWCFHGIPNLELHKVIEAIHFTKVQCSIAENTLTQNQIDKSILSYITNNDMEIVTKIIKEKLS